MQRVILRNFVDMLSVPNDTVSYFLSDKGAAWYMGIKWGIAVQNRCQDLDVPFVFDCDSFTAIALQSISCGMLNIIYRGNLTEDILTKTKIKSKVFTSILDADKFFI